MAQMLRISLGVALLIGGLMASAQEPATIDSEPAVRFAHGNGYFHYAAFCRTPKDFSAQMPKTGLPIDQIEFGIGWYVKAMVMRTEGESGSALPEIDGRIVVSQHHVRFMPANPQYAGQYVDIPREAAELKHPAGQSQGWLRGSNKDQVVNFQFRKICLSCAADTPVPPGVNDALVEQEFALLEDTIARFESGWRKTYRMSKGDSVDFASGGQPASASHPAGPGKTATASNSDTSPAVSFAPGNTAKLVAASVNSSSGAMASNSPTMPSVKATVPSMLGPSKAKPVKIGSGAAAGLIVKKIPPQYPLEAKLVRLEGTVVVRAVIDRSGDVSEVNALSGPPLLESAAVDAVKQWQYKPYAVNGQPVDVETTIEVVFALDRPQPSPRTMAVARRQGGGQ